MPQGFRLWQPRWRWQPCRVLEPVQHGNPVTAMLLPSLRLLKLLRGAAHCVAGAAAAMLRVSLMLMLIFLPGLA